MNGESLIQVAIEEAPTVIAFLKTAFGKKHPTAPLPTDAQVMAGLEQAFQSSRAKDEAWLATHPEKPPTSNTPKV